MHKKIIALIILSMVCGGIVTTAVNAQTPLPSPNNTTYDGIDVLFIIDQSGSMGGVQYGLDPRFASPPADPLGLRFLSPQFVLNELSQIRLYQVGDPKPDINMAVLAFGDDTEPLMAWTALVPEVSAGVLMPADAWDVERNKLADILSANRFGYRNLGFTDFNTAFERARDFFQSMPANLAPAPGENRLRVIILVTDGAMCKRSDVQGDVTCITVLYNGTAQRHMAQLAQQARTYFPAPGYEIFAVTLDKDNLYSGQVSTWWNDVVCQTGTATCDLSLRNALVQDEIALSAQLNRIIAYVTRYIVEEGIVTDISMTCCPPSSFTILPYQQVVRLRVFKNNPQPLPNFRFINQQTGLPVQSNPFGPDTLIETHEIRRPVPGVYTVSASSYDLVREISLASTSIAAGAELAFLNPNPITALSKFTAQVNIEDASGQVLDLYQDSTGNQLYPLTVELRLYDATSPDARTRPLMVSFPMTLDSFNNPGLHTYVVQSTLDETFEGLYELRVHATFIGDDGNTYTLLNDKRLRDNVSVQGATVQWEGLVPASQRAQRLIAVRGKVVNKQTGVSVGNTSDIHMRLEVLALDGTVVIAPTVSPNINTDMVNRPGIVESALTINMAGGYTVRSELGRLDSLGNFVPLGPVFTAPIDIRPAQFVSLSLTQPNPTEIEAQRFTLVPFQLPFELAPTTVQVEIRDQNGVGVDLATLTNGRESAPTVFIRQGADVSDVTALMTMVAPGVYALNTDALGLGEFQIEASVRTPSDQLVGDYEWASAPMSGLTLNRTVSPTVLTTSIGIGAGALIALMLTFFVYQQVMERSRHPLSGTAIIRIYTTSADGDPFPDFHQALPLGSPNRHTKTFKNIGDVRSITVSTERDSNLSKNKMMKIIECTIDGVMPEQVTGVGQILSSGNSVDIAYITLSNGGTKRIVIEKDTHLPTWGGHAGGGFNATGGWSDYGGGGTTISPDFSNLGKDTQWG